MKPLTINTYLFGRGHVVKFHFNPAGKIVYLAHFNGYGRQWVEARHLVSIDSLFNLN